MPRRIEPVEAKHLEDYPAGDTGLPEAEVTVDPKTVAPAPLFFANKDADNIEADLWERFRDPKLDGATLATAIANSPGPCATEGVTLITSEAPGRIWVVHTTDRIWWCEAEYHQESGHTFAVWTPHEAD